MLLDSLCPKDFIQIGEACYHIGNNENINWKNANSICKSVGAQLAEFKTTTEYHGVVEFLSNNQKYSKFSYWLGGLNPGLLWIWSSSARPVNPNVNLNKFNKAATNSTTELTNSIQNSTVSSTLLGATVTTLQSSKLSDNSNVIDIKGNGRCLNLLYNSTSHNYEYFGQDCNVRHGYLCELQTNRLDNEISRIARVLRLADNF